jgi:hypothetical protein
MQTLKATAAVTSGGRRVGYVGAQLSAAGVVVASAAAVCMRQGQTPDLQAMSAQQPVAWPLPARGPSHIFPVGFSNSAFGYNRAFEMELSGGKHGEGSTAIWFRQRVALVLGDGDPTGIQRLMAVADSGLHFSCRQDVRRL